MCLSQGPAQAKVAALTAVHFDVAGIGWEVSNYLVA